MVELTRTKTITIAIIAFFILIIIGLLTIAYPKYYYKSDPSDMLELVQKDSFKISPKVLAEEIIKKNQEIVLVDIRSQFEFSKGNIEGSINIPANNILDDDNFEKITEFQKQNKTIILYGRDIVEANVPFMTLYPLGIHNIKILMGGYNFFHGKNLNDIAQGNDVFDDEKSLNDINKYIAEETKKAEEVKKNTGTKNSASGKSNTGTPAAKKSATPVKHAAEVESEGC